MLITAWAVYSWPIFSIFFWGNFSYLPCFFGSFPALCLLCLFNYLTFLGNPSGLLICMSKRFYIFFFRCLSNSFFLYVVESLLFRPFSTLTLLHLFSILFSCTFLYLSSFFFKSLCWFTFISLLLFSWVWCPLFPSVSICDGFLVLFFFYPLFYTVLSVL